MIQGRRHLLRPPRRQLLRRQDLRDLARLQVCRHLGRMVEVNPAHVHMSPTMRNSCLDLQTWRQQTRTTGRP